MTSDSALLERVRKLLAKAESDGVTTAEAEALTAKAAELMARHGIDRALLAAARPETDQPDSRIIEVPNPWSGVRAYLLCGIATAMRCQCVQLSAASGRTTIGGGRPVPAPDLIGRDFTAARPDAKWCGDVTYIKTWDGWAYLAAVIDLYSRKVIGWAAAAHMRTSLVTAALGMAIASRKPPPGVIFHSDRGCQYTSAVFDDYCKENKIRRSLGRTGICPLTGQSRETRRSATRQVVLGCLPGGDAGDTPVRHEHGGFLAAA